MKFSRYNLTVEFWFLGDVMKNEFFDIEFSQNGCISSIKNVKDTEFMNWCKPNALWGKIDFEHWQGEFSSFPLSLQKFTTDENKACSIYSNASLKVMVDRFFDNDGNLHERFTLKNLRTDDLFLSEGDIAIEVPFYDEYTFADECMVRRCNTHIWCGGNSTYIKALKMGESDINLGLILTKGSIESYSITDTGSNNRGIFVLNNSHIVLLPNEEYVIEWKLFWFKDNAEFYEILNESPQYFNIDAKHHTVFENENIEFTVKAPKNQNITKILCDNNEVPFVTENGIARVNIKPFNLGELKFEIFSNTLKTYTEFYVSEEFETLLEKRIDFIVSNQQYHKEGSGLDGAFLIYDNKEKHLVYDGILRDHNASRERMAMANLLAKYLQTHKNEKFEKALKKFVEFLKREMYDENTGHVFDGIGRRGPVRLYNAPWIITFFSELYILYGDEWYLDNILKMLPDYYNGGGYKFYPNGISMRVTYNAFMKAGRKEDADKVLKYFVMHTDNMIKNGLSYPKHEVDYEQTIVSPAATYISQVGYLTGDKKYVTEAKKHISVLERFAGEQPSFHLKQIPIRYWDGFWFGKARQFGDTFPHYWSCLSARSYKAYYDISKDEKYLEFAKECIRNCLCLFNDKGEGSCAYVYPFKIRDKFYSCNRNKLIESGLMKNEKEKINSMYNKGQFYDEWANDQDYALYFALDIGVF